MPSEIDARKVLGELCEKGVLKESWNDKKNGFDYGLTDRGRSAAQQLLKNDKISQDFAFKIGWLKILEEFKRDNDIKKFAIMLLKFEQFLKQEADIELLARLQE